MKTPDENTQLALEWLQEHIKNEIDEGVLDDWIDVVEPNADDDAHLEIGDRALELISQLPKYVAIVRLLKSDKHGDRSWACELAEELN